MNIVRTIAWVMLAVFVVVFVMINYGEPQRVKVWLSEDPIGFDWPVGIIALVFWLLGVIPTWLYHRGVKWSLGRRIRSLEASIKSTALSHRHEPKSAPTPTPAPTPAPAPAPAPSLTEPGDTLTPTDSTDNKGTS